MKISQRQPLPLRLLPIDALDRMAAQVGHHGFAKRRIERLGAESREEPEALQLVLYRILHLSKAQLDALSVQTVVKLRHDVRGSDIDARHRLRRYHDPAHGRGRTRHRTEYTVAEQLRVCKEKRRIPTEQHQTGNEASLRVAADVMVALQKFDAPEHCRMRAPTVPKELNNSDHDCDPDAGKGAKHRD